MALAGAIIRARKEREGKRNESAAEARDEWLAEVVYSSSKDGGDSSVDLSRKSPTSLKTPNSRTEFADKTTKFLSHTFESDSGAEGVFESAQSYSVVYIGLVLTGMGAVITFVGLGDKGFKTLELKLIGPVLCLVGVTCVVFKIIQCICPRLFQWPKLRRSKLISTENKITTETTRNGQVMSKTRDVLSPRVTLTGQSTHKRSRPQSTVPNFIDSSDDEDLDVVPVTYNDAQQRAHQLELKRKLELVQQERIAQVATIATVSHPTPSGIVLDPNTLKG